MGARGWDFKPFTTDLFLNLRFYGLSVENFSGNLFRRFAISKLFN